MTDEKDSEEEPKFIFNLRKQGIRDALSRDIQQRCEVISRNCSPIITMNSLHTAKRELHNVKLLIAALEQNENLA